MKRILISVKNSNNNPYKVDIHPGTTPSQLLARLQLDEEYDLYRESDPTDYFSDEDLYSRVTHQEVLLAQTIFEAE